MSGRQWRRALMTFCVCAPFMTSSMTLLYEHNQDLYNKLLVIQEKVNRVLPRVEEDAIAGYRPVDAFFLGSLIPGQETVGKASLCYEERIMSNNNNWVPCAYKAPVDGLYVITITTTWYKHTGSLPDTCDGGIAVRINNVIKAEKHHCYPGRGGNSDSLIWAAQLDKNDEVKAVNWGQTSTTVLGKSRWNQMRSWFHVHLIEQIYPDGERPFVPYFPFWVTT